MSSCSVGSGISCTASLALNFTAINIEYPAYGEKDTPTPRKSAFNLVTAKQTWWS
jgi:hypothetical protein